ncbi:MAG: glycosyltransferase family 2 protein [Methylobacter sp.]
MYKEQDPEVSICIPVYRGVKYLGLAIDSVLQQSYTDFELLIIDDNSPDDIAGIVNSYQDPRIRFLCNTENLGAEGNWNRCLQEARGRYFKLLPMDDLLAPDCLEKQIKVLEQDAEQRIALVFCARSIVNEQGHVIMKKGYPFGKQGVVSGIALIRQSFWLGTNLIGEPGAILFRRSLAGKVGWFDADQPYVIDFDYWVRLLLYGDAYYLPEALASFRVSSGSWSVRIGTNQSTQFQEFMVKIAQNPAYPIKTIDLIVGNIMARLNAFVRMIIYRLVIKKN